MIDKAIAGDTRAAALVLDKAFGNAKDNEALAKAVNNVVFNVTQLAALDVPKTSAKVQDHVITVDQNVQGNDPHTTEQAAVELGPPSLDLPLHDQNKQGEDKANVL